MSPVHSTPPVAGLSAEVHPRAFDADALCNRPAQMPVASRDAAGGTPTLSTELIQLGSSESAAGSTRSADGSTCLWCAFQKVLKTSLSASHQA